MYRKYQWYRPSVIKSWPEGAFSVYPPHPRPCNNSILRSSVWDAIGQKLESVVLFGRVAVVAFFD